MRVTVQFQEPRKPYVWKNAFTAQVLFADHKIVLVRGAGSHSTFYPDGHSRSLSWKLAHPAAKNIPRRTKGWRLHPTSVRRLSAGASE